MIKVRFIVEYIYVPGCEDVCKALVRVILPSDKSGQLDQRLWSWSDEIGGSKLLHDWGTPVDGGREVVVDFHSTFWEPLKGKVSEFKLETINKVSAVVRRNLDMLKWVPPDHSVTFVFDENTGEWVAE